MMQNWRRAAQFQRAYAFVARRQGFFVEGKEGRCAFQVLCKLNRTNRPPSPGSWPAGGPRWAAVALSARPRMSFCRPEGATTDQPRAAPGVKVPKRNKP